MVQINPGKLEYASAVDLVESQSKLDSQIEASEQNVLNAIKQNDDDALDLLEDRYDQLGTLSKSLANAGKKIRDDRRAEFIKDINYRLLTEGISPELKAKFYGDREQLFNDGININIAANNWIEETGDTISAREFQKMNKWEKYTFVEAWVRNKAKEYPEYYYRAYNETTINVNGVEKSYKTGNLSVAEEAMLDAKIKREFGAQFAGISESLIAEVAKPEIDTFDDMRRKKRVAAKEQMWWAERGALDQKALADGISITTPAGKIDSFNKWIANYMSNYKVDMSTARKAYKANLIALVSDPNSGVTVTDAITLLNTTFTGNDGNPRTIQSWTEFDDIESDLIQASKTRETAKADVFDDTVDFYVNAITEDQDNLTWQNKAQIEEHFKKKYGFVPVRISEALRGHLPDDIGKAFLENQLLVQDGVLYDYQLAKVSGDLKREYSPKLATAFNSDASFDKGVQTFLKSATNQAMNTNLGETEAKSIPWLTMQSNITELYRETYRQYIDSSGTPSDAKTIAEAHKLANAKVQEKIEDTAWVNKAMTTDYQKYKAEHGDEAYAEMVAETELYGKNVFSGMQQSEDGAWQKNIIKIDSEYMKKLLDWGTNPNRTLKDVPQVYKDIARRNYIANPLEFAETQLKLLLDSEEDFGIPERGKYIKANESDLNKEIQNKPEVLKFLTGHTNKGKTIQAYVAFHELDTEESGFTFFNDSAFTSPELE